MKFHMSRPALPARIDCLISNMQEVLDGEHSTLSFTSKQALNLTPATCNSAGLHVFIADALGTGISPAFCHIIELIARSPSTSVQWYHLQYRAPSSSNQHGWNAQIAWLSEIQRPGRVFCA